MPVQYTTKPAAPAADYVSGLAFIAKVDTVLPPAFAYLQQAQIAGKLKIELTATGLRFLLPQKAAPGQALWVAHHTINLTVAMIKAINSGLASVGLRKDLGEAIMGAIDLLKKQIPAGEAVKAMQVSPDAAGDIGLMAAIAKDPPAPAPASVPVAMAAAKAAPDGWGYYNPAQMDSGQTLELKTAPRLLYQPVRGTSPSSRYYQVGGSDGLRVAARYSSGSLSVRIEGSEFAKYVPKMVLAGLDVKGDKGYASIHVAVDNDVLAAKTLGAILLGLGIPMNSPLPSVLTLKNK
jgi:hypothetical protein